MTGIERLRLCERQLRADLHELYIKHVWDINVVPLYEEIKECLCALDAIADQIEREIDEAVADEVAGTLSAYEMNTNARWYSAVEEGAESDCKAEYELISRYWLPRPRFEDGEPVQFGDEFVAWNGTVGTVTAINVVDNARLIIINSSSSNNYIVGAKDSHGKFAKRPEPPKVLDADGVEIKVGDEVWVIDSGRHCKVFEVRETGVGVDFIDGDRGPIVSEIQAFNLTHKRPEPPDTWERIEADSKKHYCAYFGRAGMFECAIGERYACPLSELDDECETRMAQDLVRRCKALAGVE